MNPFPNKPLVLCACSTSLLEKKKLGKGETAHNFFFSNRVFYLFEEFSVIFIKFEIVVCKLFQFVSIQNVVNW